MHASSIQLSDFKESINKEMLDDTLKVLLGIKSKPLTPEKISEQLCLEAKAIKRPPIPTQQDIDKYLHDNKYPTCTDIGICMHDHP